MDIKFCRKCGAKLEKDAIYCVNCGTKIINSDISDEHEAINIEEQQESISDENSESAVKLEAVAESRPLLDISDKGAKTISIVMGFIAGVAVIFIGFGIIMSGLTYMATVWLYNFLTDNRFKSNWRYLTISYFAGVVFINLFAQWYVYNSI